MVQNVLDLPASMIRRRVDRRGYQLEAIVVSILGILGGIGMAYIAYRVLPGMEQGMEEARFVLIGEIVTPLITLFLLWVGYTVLSHFLSTLYNGRGPLSRLFRTTAWSLLPIALWFIIRALVVVGIFYGVDIPDDPPGFGGEERVTNVLYGNELGHEGLSSPIYTATILVGTVFVVWSWYLLSIAVERSKSVATENARKIAAVPAGAFALYVLWQALGNAGIV